MNKFLTSFCSEKGKRENNQDFGAFSEQDGHYRAWGLSDGLGGHAHGETAACIAVQSILEDFSNRPDLSDQALQDYFFEANRKILRQQEIPGYAGTRTTCSVLFTDSSQIRSANIGDTRVYFFPNGGEIRVTADHSVAYSAFLLGEIPYHEIREHPDRNKLSRTLGYQGEIRVNLSDPAPASPGDAFLLCTDGFWEFVYEEDMSRTLNESSTPDGWLDKMLAIHHERSFDRQTDNYSAIAVMVI